MATWRTVFEELGGFDLSFCSTLFQDADYCLRVRQDGRRVYYQPASVVVRLGGLRPPTTEEPDRHRFAERWARAGGAGVG
jgi:GT2 family glycosyltransferase